MRDLVLLISRHLADGAPAGLLGQWLKYRVVAKATIASRRVRDSALERAFGLLNNFAILHEHEDALIASGPLVRWQAIELVQELLVVVLVRGVLARVASGVDARSAVERVDLDSRVISERREARLPP